MSVQTETAYQRFIDSQITLKNEKDLVKRQIQAVQNSGEDAARSARNATDGTIQEKVLASRAAFAPYKAQIDALNAHIAELTSASDEAWRNYEIARGVVQA